MFYINSTVKLVYKDVLMAAENAGKDFRWWWRYGFIQSTLFPKIFLVLQLEVHKLMCCTGSDGFRARIL